MVNQREILSCQIVLSDHTVFLGDWRCQIIQSKSKDWEKRQTKSRLSWWKMGLGQILRLYWSWWSWLWSGSDHNIDALHTSIHPIWSKLRSFFVTRAISHLLLLTEFNFNNKDNLCHLFWSCYSEDRESVWECVCAVNYLKNHYALLFLFRALSLTTLSTIWRQYGTSTQGKSWGFLDDILKELFGWIGKLV